MEDFEGFMSEMMRNMSVAIDGWMGGSPSEKLELIRASELFDKAILVKHHIRGRRECEGKSGMSCVKTSVRESPSRPSVPLKGLRAIQLPELRVGECHTGRVLYGMLCVDAFKIVGILTIMEDGCGRAVKLQIYNAALSTATSADVQRLYPKGANVAIKEPYFKRAGDGLLMVRVDNPRSIEFLDNSPLLAHRNPPSNSARVEELRQCGNRCFAERDWNGAIRFYSLCIEKGSDRKAASASMSRDQDVLLGYSNRAEARLKLGNFEEALSDCDRALQIDPNHLKSLYRKGRALHGLQQYEEAAACFRSALQNSPQNDEIRVCLERSCEFDSQSRTGKYDVSAYLLSKRDEDAPEVADFVGPVAVKKTRDRRGRGLFVTREVTSGELLLVTNALAVADVDDSGRILYMDAHDRRLVLKTECDEDLVTKLVSLATSSPKAMRQLYSLADSCGQEGMEVPSMELFEPNAAYSYCQLLRGRPAEHTEVDVERIRNIVRLNSYERGFPLEAENQRAGTKHSSGLWILPSFINHSCLPNARKLRIGGAMFVHAACNIRKGQEVTAEYFNTLVPLFLRSEKCKQWEFTCSCRRCHVERSLHVSMDRMIKKFGIESWEGITESPKFVEEVENFLRSADHGLKAEEIDWIRASYHPAYAQAFTCPDLFTSAIPTEAEYADSLKRTVPGSPFLLLLASMVSGKAPSRRQKQKAVEMAKEACVAAVEMAKEACVAAVGNQEERVVSALLRDPMSIFHFV